MKSNKKPTVILLSSKAQSGKDYISNIIKNKLESKGKKVLITHYADLLKYICKTFFNWDGQKDDTGRTLLQKVGTEGIRTKNPNFWVDFIKFIITTFPNEWDVILIPDTRFPNEINCMKRCDDFNTIAIRIIRDNYINTLTKEQKNHLSETALDNYKNFDITIHNDSTIPNKAEMEVDKILDTFFKDNKQNLFCDFDGTLAKSIETIVELYNEDFKYYDQFKPILPEDIKTWNFDELTLATPECIDHYFNQKRFFDKLEMHFSMLLALDKLSQFYNIKIISSGYPANLKLKQKYLNDNLMFDFEFIGVDLSTYKDKSHIDMSNGIFIDDLYENLLTSNAAMKICYGKKLPWNIKWNGLRCYSGLDLLNYVLDKKQI